MRQEVGEKGIAGLPSSVNFWQPGQDGQELARVLDLAVLVCSGQAGELLGIGASLGDGVITLLGDGDEEKSDCREHREHDQEQEPQSQAGKQC